MFASPNSTTGVVEVFLRSPIGQSVELHGGDIAQVEHTDAIHLYGVEIRGIRVSDQIDLYAIDMKLKHELGLFIELGPQTLYEFMFNPSPVKLGETEHVDIHRVPMS
jgi:hypothetical protein